NARGERLGTNDVLEAVAGRAKDEDDKRKREADEEDERLARQAFETAGGQRVKRAREEDAVERERQIKNAVKSVARESKTAKTLSLAALGVKRVKPKAVVEKPPATLSNMLGAYGSDSDDADDA
ncbi:hypothetical protein FBU59_002084, partial [Linderina macrospora]